MEKDNIKQTSQRKRNSFIKREEFFIDSRIAGFGVDFECQMM